MRCGGDPLRRGVLGGFRNGKIDGVAVWLARLAGCGRRGGFSRLLKGFVQIPRSAPIFRAVVGLLWPRGSRLAGGGPAGCPREGSLCCVVSWLLSVLCVSRCCWEARGSRGRLVEGAACLGASVAGGVLVAREKWRSNV